MLEENDTVLVLLAVWPGLLTVKVLILVENIQNMGPCEAHNHQIISQPEGPDVKGEIY